PRCLLMGFQAVFEGLSPDRIDPGERTALEEDLPRNETRPDVTLRHGAARERGAPVPATPAKPTLLWAQHGMSNARLPRPTEDYDQNKILLTSPIGQGLVGKKLGDVVEVPVPRGTLKLRIIEISIA